MLLDAAIWVPDGLRARGSQTGNLGNPVDIFGGGEGGRWCVLAGSVNVFIGTVTALAAPPASGHIWGDRPPPPTTWVFLFFSYMIFFNYYLRGLDFLVLILSPPFLVALKGSKFG